MDDKRFDGITQALATERSRRRMVGGLIGGVAALLGGAAALEAKKGGNGKSRGRGRRNNGNGNGNGNGGNGNGGNGNGNGNGNGGNGRGRGRVKVSICHRTNGGGFNFITVGQPAVPAHERHGDTVCETEDACSVATGCDDDGACVFEAAEEGTACEVEGDAGVCTAEGECDTGDEPAPE